MRVRAFALLLATLLLFGLAGCSSLNFGNVNDLLRAPAMGQTQGEVQRALEAGVPGALTYKYPREGDHLSPLLLQDISGDGREECIAFYSLPEAGGLVNIALLEQDGDGWRLAYTMEGQGTDVASVSVADMFGDGSRQLVVGYSNAAQGNKTLVLYEYRDNALVQTSFSGLYEQYLLDDFTGGGRQELVVVTNDAGLRLDFFTGEGGRFQSLQENSVLLHEYIGSCLGIHASVTAEGERYLVVDGRLAQTDHVVSQILVYSPGGRFYSRETDANLTSAITATDRGTSTLLLSRDLDGDGAVEIPVPAEGVYPSDISDLLVDDLQFIDWKDFIPEETQTRFFGLFDSYHGLFVRFPEAWRGIVEIQPGEVDGAWRVYRNEVLLVELAIPEEDEIPELATRIVGTQNAWLLLGEGLNTIERNTIQYLLLT